ncbi:ATP-dependent DNA helicase PIF1-like [Octopus vulgaris]|uniref:ATP-dependent DNA helicase PIF1-like n=1 Tax=Octopus vulgaris TaxID=6645 RepID=A0AA36FAI6_OCTVU|nr:ATP-dependent DNA helicase PIF1-like [Octopus vulgaris]
MRLLNKIEHRLRPYNSIDQIVDTNEAVNFPVEFLNSLEILEFPPHELYLKKGAPVILLRNLQTPKLCSGTRLIVESRTNNVPEAKILNGKYKNELALLPRVKLIAEDPVITIFC